MSNSTEKEGTSQKWKKIVAHELFEYGCNFAFIYFFLTSFAWYRRLILAEYDIEYSEYWMPLIEAAVLAKVIMIGDALRLGRRFREWPLVVPTIYRTIVFSLLVVLFAVLEHVVRALLQGKKASEGIAELAGKGWYELAAKYILIITAFLPFFAIKEIERAFGPEKVRGMFFGTRGEERTVSAVEEKS